MAVTSKRGKHRGEVVEEQTLNQEILGSVPTGGSVLCL